MRARWWHSGDTSVGHAPTKPLLGTRGRGLGFPKARLEQPSKAELLALLRILGLLFASIK